MAWAFTRLSSIGVWRYLRIRRRSNQSTFSFSVYFLMRPLDWKIVTQQSKTIDMKQMNVKTICKPIAKVLLVVALFLCHLTAFADNDWVMVFQNADREMMEVPMSQVGSLVAVDDAYDFTILSTSGSVIAEGVTKVSFENHGSSGIHPIVLSKDMIARAASDKLTLIGVSGEVTVYDTGGVQQLQVMATGGETVISIAHLPAAVYVVQVGKQTFKFMKK